MAISTLFKANQFQLSKTRHNFDAKFGCIKSPDMLRLRSRFPGGGKVKSFINYSTSSSNSIAKKGIGSADPFKLVSTSSSSNSKSIENKKHHVLGTILKALKLVRVPAIVMVLCLFVTMTMYRCESALAITDGSFSKSSSPKPCTFLFYDESEEEEKGAYAKNPMHGVLLFVLLCLFFIYKHVSLYWEETEVIKLQVALSVGGQNLRKELNRIARTTNKDDWRRILMSTIDSLLQHEKFWISGYSSMEVEVSIEDAEEYFKKLVKMEKVRFGVEPVVNLYDMEKGRITSQKAKQPRFTCMVVTMLVAGKGIFLKPKIPVIVDPQDVKRSLHELRSFCKHGKIRAANVFWIPLEENDTVSVEQYMKKYPHLKPSEYTQIWSNALNAK